MGMRITQKAFAAHVGLQQPRVAKLVAAGVLDLKRGLDQSRLDYIEHLRQAASGRGGGGDYDLQAERARLSHHQANIAAITEKQTTGKLVPTRWHHNSHAILSRVLHSRLGSLANRVISLNPGLPEAVRQELIKGVTEARQDIGDSIKEAMADHINQLPEEHRDA